MRLIIITIILLLFTVTFVSASIQISPEKITFNNVLRDSYAENNLVITADSGSYNVNFNLDGELKDYFTIESLNEFSSSNPLNVKLILRTPANLQNGVYPNFLTMTFDSKSSPEINTIGKLSKVIPIDVYVTDTIIKQLEVNNIILNDIRENEEFYLIIDWENKGNTVVEPKINVKIYDLSNSLVKDQDFYTTLLPKKDSFTINLGNFNKNQYKAIIKIFLDDNLVQERSLNFFVLAPNEKISKGILNSVTNQEKAHPNDKIKITADFQNTGESILEVVLKTEIFLNTNPLDVIESNKQFVKPEQTIELENFFTPRDVGLYKLNNYVEYSNKVSNTKESVFEVVPSNEPLKEIPLSANPMFLILGMALLIFVYIRVHRARRRKDGK